MTWASATTSVATITAAGLATGVAAGTSTISATLGGITGSTVLTVTAAALQSIAVTPANPRRQGTTQQFTATGTYSDSDAEPDQPGDLGLGHHLGRHHQRRGLATGVAAGTSTISATLGGVSGSTVLTVTAAALQSIAVTPANSEHRQGADPAVHRHRHLLRQLDQNLTSQVTWASATTSVATITAAGLATGVATGTFTSAPRSARQRLDGADRHRRALQSIAVTPANPASPRDDPAVHRHRDLLRQLDAEPDQPGDLGLGHHLGRHDHLGGIGHRVGAGTSHQRHARVGHRLDRPDGHRRPLQSIAVTPAIP